MTKKSKKLSLALIPCFNEELTIASMVIKSKKYVDTVLVVDDGSSDDTTAIAEKVGAVVITHEKNSGKSAAIKTGFRYALENDYAYVITIDGDGQHNADEIPLLLKDLEENKFDVALGVRYGETTEMPGWRKVGKRVLDYTTSLGHGGNVTDSQSGFRGFNQNALKSITPRLNGDSFSVESEQLIRSHDAGLTMGNTRISCKYKGLDTSTKNPASHGVSVLSYVIWMVAEKRPLLFIGVPSLISLIIGVLIGIYTLQLLSLNQYNITSAIIFPYAILVSMFIIIGALGMFMGLMLHVLPSIVKRSRVE